MNAMTSLHPSIKHFKFIGLCVALCLAGCGLNATQPLATPETVVIEVTRLVRVNSTPETIVVTSVVTVEVPVVITVTPTPYLNKDCFQKAITQGELNECAVGQRELAEAQLAETVAAIKLSPSDQELFDTMQTEWHAKIEQDCRFMFGRVLTSEDGDLYYEHGSMGPMLYTQCLTSNIERRNKELRFAYYLEH